MPTLILHGNYLNMILKKTYFHYEVWLDQLFNFILIIFLKLLLSTAGNKTHISSYIKCSNKRVVLKQLKDSREQNTSHDLWYLPWKG